MAALHLSAENFKQEVLEAKGNKRQGFGRFFCNLVRTLPYDEPDC